VVAVLLSASCCGTVGMCCIKSSTHWMERTIYHRNGRDDLWRREQCLLKCGVLIQKGEEKIRKFEQQVAALPGRKGGDGSRQNGMRSKRSSGNSGPSKAQRPSLLTGGASPTKSSWQQCLGFRPSVVFGTGVPSFE
jgi:hypothetical protein